MVLKFGAEKCFVFIISILLLTDLAILLNIPFLRQIFGFLFLTLLPGFLILKIFKLNKIGFTEKIVLSVGLSISFLMFFGLLLNTLSLSLGYETPLATVPVLISLNIACILLAITGYKLNKNTVFSLPNLNLSTSEKAFLIVPILFPVLSIFGMHLMNTTDNNIILMLLYLVIPLYVIFVCFFNQKFPKRLYPVIIFLISISLLLIWTLRFPHIFGRDIHTEYYLFRTTLTNLHWGIVIHNTLDACLSISLLPAIFQSIMNTNAQEYLFRGVYATICTFGPLAIYILAKKYIAELYAFLACFFYMSQPTFLNAPVSPRTNVAIFFAALAVMVFFNDQIEPVKRRFLFIVFIFSMAVSHYSGTYIFFFMMLFTFFAVGIFPKKYTLNKKITLASVLSFFAFIFFWYSQITTVAFNSGIRFIDKTFLSLNNFFIAESRDPAIAGLYGQKLTYPVLSEVNFAVTWGTFILIAIGVFMMLLRYKEMISISNEKRKKPDFLKTKFELEFLAMALACSGILVSITVLPRVSLGYQIQRTYSLMAIILSICFIIGGVTLSHFFFFYKKRKPVLKEKNNGLQNRAYLVILIILMPYFLFQTGALYQSVDHSNSLILNSEGEKYDTEFLHDQESCAAKWLKTNAEKNNISTDRFGKLKLISQGEFLPSSISSSLFSGHRKIKGYIYLSYFNVVNGTFTTGYHSGKHISNVSNYADMFIGKKKIYDNDGSEVWI